VPEGEHLQVLDTGGGKWSQVRWDRPKKDGGPVDGWVLTANIELDQSAPQQEYALAPKPEPEPEPMPEPEPESAQGDMAPYSPALYSPGNMTPARSPGGAPGAPGGVAIHPKKKAGTPPSGPPPPGQQGVIPYGAELKTYIVALYTGEVSEADRTQEWFIPDPAPAWVEQVHEEMRPSPTSPDTCCSVRLRLTGTDGHHDEAERIYPVGENMVVEKTIVCQDVGDVRGVTLTLEDSPDYPVRDWSARRWKLEKVVITCIQHHHGAQAVHGGDLPKGDYVESTSTTRDALQWHLHDPQWLGQMPAQHFWHLKLDLEQKHQELANATTHVMQVQQTLVQAQQAFELATEQEGHAALQLKSLAPAAGLTGTETTTIHAAPAMDRAHQEWMVLKKATVRSHNHKKGSSFAHCCGSHAHDDAFCSHNRVGSRKPTRQANGTGGTIVIAKPGATPHAVNEGESHGGEVIELLDGHFLKVKTSQGKELCRPHAAQPNN
jgi:hypothetical protein